MRFILPLLLVPFFLNAQTCKCEDELNFVISYYEANLPGFKDNVNPQNSNWYKGFKDKLLSDSRSICENKQECFKVLTAYVEFFKDNHSSIRYNEKIAINEKDSTSLKQFYDSDTYKNCEIVDLKNIKFKLNSINVLENTYQTMDSTYTVRVIKSKTTLRDYAGVIIDSRTPLWKKGQVKFELKSNGDGTYEMFSYYRNHSLVYFKKVKLKDGILQGTFFNVQLKKRNAFAYLTPNNLVFKPLNETTNYMYVPTFSAQWMAKLDSFYKACDPMIRSKENLIIDLRNNGGGSDACANPLLKYTYSRPFLTDSVELYVTEENIRKSMQWYNENKHDTINFNETFMNEILDEIEEMKKAPSNTFIIRSKPDTFKLDSVLKYPKNIVMLVNANCASSTEDFLFCCKESEKTVLLGENTGGYVAYGEISEIETPNFAFRLGCTMTRFPNRISCEATGIAPDYYLDNNSDWVEQAMKIVSLKKK